MERSNLMNKFWIDTCTRLQNIENFPQIMSELQQFHATHQNVHPLQLENNADVQNMSNETKSFIHIVSSLAKINPHITCHVGMNAVQLPEEANNIILNKKRQELEDQGIEIPDGLRVMPAYARYEFILVTGDPDCVPIINEIYLVWRQMMHAHEIEMSDDWVVVKFRPPVPAHNPVSRAPLIFKGEVVPPTVIRYIIQKPDADQSVSEVNPVECILQLHMSYINGRFATQDDVNQFRLAILSWIDTKIGNYKSFMWVHSISIVPNALWSQVSSSFPEHYKLKDWDQKIFIEDLEALIPKTKKCILCNLHEENTTMFPLLQSYKCMPAGDYCQYCFSLFARILNIT